MKNKINLVIISLILTILLISNASATLESAIFGFGKDMALTYISSQNPVLGKAISFALCAQCAITSEALGIVGQISPELAKGLGIGMDPKGAIVGQAKQQLLGQIYKQLNPKEQQIVSNIQKFEPYVKEAFRENPNAPKGQEKATIEIDQDGNTIIKDSEGNIFAKIPEGFEAVESKDAFILVNKEAKSDVVLEIKDYKIKAGKDAKISFSEKEGVSLISLEGSGNIDAAGTQLNNIKDATVRVDKNKQVEYAEFTSTQKGNYKFTYNNEDFTFVTNPNSYIKFDPKAGKLSGKNINFNYKNQNIQALQLDAIWDKGAFKEIRLSAKGVYKDLDNNLEYSSKEDFAVYLDGRDIFKEKNAISVLKEGPRVQLDAKGKIKISNKNGITYEGLTENVYTKYRTWDSVFDVKYGDALIDNGMHQVRFDKGETYLSTRNLAKEGQAETFTFRYTKDKEEKDVSYTIVNEESGNLELISLKDGKETKTVLYSLRDYQSKVENAIQDDLTSVNTRDMRLEIEQNLREIDEQIKVKLTKGEDVTDLKKQKSALEFTAVGLDAQESIVNNDIDGAINKLENFANARKGQEPAFLAKSAIASLYETKANSIGDSIRFSYKPGQQVVEAKGEGFVLLGEISKVDDKGVYIDYSKGVYRSIKKEEYLTLEQLDKLKLEEGYSISRYVIGEQRIARIQYDPQKKEFMYSEEKLALPDLRESALFSTETKSVIEGIENNYQKAIQSLKEISVTTDTETKKQIQDIIIGMEGRAKLSKVNTYLLADDYNNALTEAYDIIRDHKFFESDARYLAGIAYLQKGDPRNALVSFDYAVKANPESESAKESISRKKELESAFLDTISSAISQEDAQIAKMWEDKTGLNKPIWNVGVAKSVMCIFGYCEALEQISSQMRTELNNRQRGIILIKGLRNKGYDLETIKDLDSDTIAKEFNLPTNSKDETERKNAFRTSAEIKVAIQDAFNNPDVAKLAAGARTPFNLETGEGYVDKSFLERNWQDKVLDTVNMKNVIIFAAPMAKVGKGVAFTTGIARGGIGAKIPVIGKIGSEAYYVKLATSPTAVSAIGGGIRSGLEAVPGIKTVLKTGDSLKEITANSRIIQAISSKAPTLTKVGTWVGSNAVENAAGAGAGKIAGLIHPALELPVNIIINYGSSYANIFDMTQNVITASAKTGLKLAQPSISKALITEADETITALKFGKIQDLENYINTAKATQGVKQISENLYDYKGKKFFVFVDDSELNNLGGLKDALEPKELIALQNENIANLQKNNPLKVFERPESISFIEDGEEFMRLSPTPYSQELKVLTRSNQLGGEIDTIVEHEVDGINVIAKRIETPKKGETINIIGTQDEFPSIVTGIEKLDPEYLQRIDLKTTFGIDKPFDQLTAAQKLEVMGMITEAKGYSSLSSSFGKEDAAFSVHTHPLDDLPEEYGITDDILIKNAKEKPFSTDFATPSTLKEIREEAMQTVKGKISNLEFQNARISGKINNPTTSLLNDRANMARNALDDFEQAGYVEVFGKESVRYSDYAADVTKKMEKEGLLSNFDPETGKDLRGFEITDSDKIKKRIEIFLEDYKKCYTCLKANINKEAIEEYKNTFKKTISMNNEWLEHNKDLLNNLETGTDAEVYFTAIRGRVARPSITKTAEGLRGDIPVLLRQESITLGSGAKVQLMEIAYPHGRLYVVHKFGSDKIHIARTNAYSGWDMSAAPIEELRDYYTFF